MADPRPEIVVPPAAGPTEISKIAFDEQGRMFLAERPEPTGAFDFAQLSRRRRRAASCVTSVSCRPAGRRNGGRCPKNIPSASRASCATPMAAWRFPISTTVGDGSTTTAAAVFCGRLARICAPPPIPRRRRNCAIGAPNMSRACKASKAGASAATTRRRCTPISPITTTISTMFPRAAIWATWRSSAPADWRKAGARTSGAKAAPARRRCSASRPADPRDRQNRRRRTNVRCSALVRRRLPRLAVRRPIALRRPAGPTSGADATANASRFPVPRPARWWAAIAASRASWRRRPAPIAPAVRFLWGRAIPAARPRRSIRANGVSACCSGQVVNGQCQPGTPNNPGAPQCQPGQTPPCCGAGYIQTGNICCLSGQATANGTCCPVGETPVGDQCQPIHFTPPGPACCAAGQTQTMNGQCCATANITTQGICCPTAVNPQEPGHCPAQIQSIAACQPGYTRMPDKSCCLDVACVERRQELRENCAAHAGSAAARVATADGRLLSARAALHPRPQTSLRLPALRTRHDRQ